jgi:hypothetical protein
MDIKVNPVVTNVLAAAQQECCIPHPESFVFHPLGSPSYLDEAVERAEDAAARCADAWLYACGVQDATIENIDFSDDDAIVMILDVIIAGCSETFVIPEADLEPLEITEIRTVRAMFDAVNEAELAEQFFIANVDQLADVCLTENDLLALATCQRSEVRLIAAQSENATVASLMSLLLDDDPRVIEAVIANVNADDMVLTAGFFQLTRVEKISVHDPRSIF